MLKCVHLSYFGEKIIKTKIMDKLNYNDDVYNFFNACHTYELHSLKKLAKTHFSTEYQLLSLFYWELANTINKAELHIMEKSFGNLIIKKPELLDTHKYKDANTVLF